jgi:hypothetical protein
VGLTNEIGEGPFRARPVVPDEEAREQLRCLGAQELPEGLVMTGSPTTCPACGSTAILWGCDDGQPFGQEHIHPLIWNDEQWLADTFMCLECSAGWIEPDEPAVVQWVRPYWKATEPDGRL